MNKDYKKVKINTIIIDDVSVKDNEYVIDDIANRVLTKELKLLLLTRYTKNKKLIIKDSIKITTDDKDLLKDDIVKLVISSRTIIGKGKIRSISNDYVEINELEIYIDDDYTKDINKLFTNTNNVDINKYIEGLFYYYYRYLIRLIEDNNLDHSFKKLSAVSSYVISRDLFETKHYNVAPNNSFIRNCGIEFDLLLLKDGVDNSEYVYDFDDVLCIVELKANGYINKISKFEDFENYIIFNGRKQVEDDNILEKVRKIPFIYLSYYEQIDNYRNIIKAITNKHNRKGMILSVKDDNEYFYIPNDYDIDKIIKINK